MTIELKEKQAKEIVAGLKSQGIAQEGLERKQIIALIAYLQCLGQKTIQKGASNDKSVAGSL